jgi:hypothetical protein
MRFTGEPERVDVELLRQQWPAAKPEQIMFPVFAGCIQCTRVRVQQAHPFAGFGEGGWIDAGILGLAGTPACGPTRIKLFTPD